LLDGDTNPTIESAQNSSLKRLITRQLQKLDGREQLILTARWGLDGRPTRTLAQLADQLEVSRELVRQLEKSALRKLQVDAALNDAFQQLSA
jgi:RNA polymerase sigma factor (sigma-70 family)